MDQDPVINEDFQVIMTMNVNGHGTDYMQELAFKAVINQHFPSVVLLQEFRWGSLEVFFNNIPIIPETYFFHNDNLHLEEPWILVDTANVQMIHLVNAQMNENQHLIPRLCLRRQVRQTKPDIIFISWHGRHKINLDQKRHQFENLMQFATHINAILQLPVLIAGDFNLEISHARNLVHNPFILYDYGGSERRLRRNVITVIDYFIATRDLHLFDMQPINPRGLHIVAVLANDQLARYQRVQDRTSPFDHDPIIAKLEDNPLLEIFHPGNVHSEDTCIKCEFKHLLSLLTNLFDHI